MAPSRAALWLIMAGAGLLAYLLVPRAASDLVADALSDALSGARAVSLAPRSAAGAVIVVAVDEPWPPPPDVLAKAVQALDHAGAEVIGLEARIDAGTGLDALAAAIKASGHVVLREQRFGTSTLPWHPSLAGVAAGRGVVRFAHGAGPEVRGVSLDSDAYLIELVRRARSPNDARIERGRVMLTGPLAKAHAIGLADGVSLLFQPPAPSELSRVPLADLLAGKAGEAALQGRIVLFGATSPAHAAPVELPGGAVWPQVMVEAAALDAMLSGRAIEPAGIGVQLATCVLLFGVLVLSGSFGGWWTASLAALVVLLAQAAYSVASYVWFSWRPEPLAPLVGLAVAAALLTAGRFWGALLETGRLAELIGHNAERVAAEAYARAVELVGAGRHQTAIPLLQKVMRSDGARRNQALVQMLFCYLAANELELIEDTFKQIFIEQLSLEECYSLGLKMAEHGYFEEARALYALIYNRDVNYRDVKRQLELVVQQQASRTDVVERLIFKELRKDYRNIEMVRRGGMAIIYRGYWAQQDRTVAVKILTPHLNDDANVVKRFFLEADTMKEFDHPNIVKVFNIYRDGQLKYYSMESVHPADTLYDVIEKEKKLPVARAIHILKQMCLALAYAHERHVVHRDIKPHNVLIAPGDVVKLIDFGIARFEALSTMTSTGVVMGTPRYMSPEQIKGERVDERTDIYACGVSFFEMLTGILGSENPMLDKIKGRTSIYQLILRQNLPSPLVRMVLKCLEASRDRRYSSARELYTDLEEYERLPQAALEM